MASSVRRVAVPVVCATSATCSTSGIVSSPASSRRAPSAAAKRRDSLRYAQLGTEAAARSRGTARTAGVLLASSEARALAALNRLDEVHIAVARAAEARDRVQPDKLDILGGICNFSRPPQLHYAAEALFWGGAPQASHAEQFALEALNAYAAAPQGSSIRNEANTRGAIEAFTSERLMQPR
jgi:hypothetical protein